MKPADAAAAAAPVCAKANTENVVPKAAIEVLDLCDSQSDDAPVTAVAAAPPDAAAARASPAGKRHLDDEGTKKSDDGDAVRAAQRARRAAPRDDEDDVIDLTDEDVNAAFKQWELIDLTEEADNGPNGEPSAAAHAPGRSRAAPRSPASRPRPPVEDALAPQRARIRAFLAAKAQVLRVRSCEPNPHSVPGTRLYARFVAARARCADKSVQLVFHGTPEANVASICRDGLDPRRRAGQAMGPGGVPR